MPAPGGKNCRDGGLRARHGLRRGESSKARVGLLEDAHGMRGTQMWLDYLRLTTGHRAALWRRVEAERDRVWQDELNRRQAAKAALRAERAAERRLEGPGDPDDQRAA